jgi:hypothetical protein
LQIEKDRLAQEKRVFEKEKTQFEENLKLLNSDKEEIQIERQNLISLSEELQKELKSIHLRLSQLELIEKKIPTEELPESDENSNGTDEENCVVM